LLFNLDDHGNSINSSEIVPVVSPSPPISNPQEIVKKLPNKIEINGTFFNLYYS
jgi:hypothetical protein